MSDFKKKNAAIHIFRYLLNSIGLAINSHCSNYEFHLTKHLNMSSKSVELTLSYDIICSEKYTECNVFSVTFHLTSIFILLILNAFQAATAIQHSNHILSYIYSYSMML